jgi:hypothetical protein
MLEKKLKLITDLPIIPRRTPSYKGKELGGTREAIINLRPEVYNCR